MSFDIPEDLRYTESHEWAADEGDTVRVGITDFAQDELGDLVFVELPATGETVETGDPFATVESIKAISDIYAPVSGTVVATNEALLDAPEAINEDPYGDGWLVDVEPEGEASLLEPSEYAEQIE
jgi:glycine cleavage system H protein